jgi:hypothetical protein
MRIAIQAVISDVEGQEPCTENIEVLEYNAEAVPSSGLCFFIGAPRAFNERVAALSGVTITHHGSYWGAVWWCRCGLMLRATCGEVGGSSGSSGASACSMARGRRALSDYLGYRRAGSLLRCRSNHVVSLRLCSNRTRTLSLNRRSLSYHVKT